MNKKAFVALSLFALHGKKRSREERKKKNEKKKMKEGKTNGCFFSFFTLRRFFASAKTFSFFFVDDFSIRFNHVAPGRVDAKHHHAQGLVQDRDRVLRVRRQQVKEKKE